jgi:hypothetical protein
MEDARTLEADNLRAKVFRDREHLNDWRVEKMDEEGWYEVALFTDARQRHLVRRSRLWQL